MSTLIYVFNYAVEGIKEEQKYAFTLELVLRSVIIISILYFAFFEFVSIFRDWRTYLTDVFNYFDWITFFLNSYIVHNIVKPNSSSPDDTQSAEESLSRALEANDDQETPADMLEKDR